MYFARIEAGGQEMHGKGLGRALESVCVSLCEEGS
jgi:hypothetical protein